MFFQIDCTQLYDNYKRHFYVTSQNSTQCNKTYNTLHNFPQLYKTVHNSTSFAKQSTTL